MSYDTCVMLMLSLSLPVYQVKLDCLPLYCLDSAQPAELSRSSVGRAFAS